MRTGSSRPRRGMALPMTLFFVLMAFFVASAILVRANFEARATVLETNSIQQEALGRAALATLQAQLNAAAGEDGVGRVSLNGPGGMKAAAWWEKDREKDDIYRLFARVDGGLGKAKISQRVMRKTPVLDSVDLVHLTDGDLDTADVVKVRLADSGSWTDLALRTKVGDVSLVWMEADRRGHVFGNDFPVLSGAQNDILPRWLVQQVVANNENLLNQGRISFTFFPLVAKAIDDDDDFNIGSLAWIAAPVMGQGSDLVKPVRTLVDGLAQGASVRYYSSETGEWAKAPIPLAPSVSGQLPGAPASDGKKLYLPIMQAGADRLATFDFATKRWSNLPTPPALTGGAQGTQMIVEVDADDSGYVYCRHGDGDQVGLSRFDPETQKWSLLTPPPDVTRTPDGTFATTTRPAENWGELELDEVGDLFAVRREPDSSKSKDPVAVPVAGAEEVKDMVLKYHDARWTVMQGMTAGMEVLGSFSTGPQGRFTLQDVRSGADKLLVRDGRATTFSTSEVEGMQQGVSASYFSADSGGKPVQGKFKFLETAEY